MCNTIYMSDKHQDISSLREVVDQVDTIDTEKKDIISVREIIESLGRDSFGPVILLVGLFMIIPGLSDIPGVSILVGSIIALFAGQFLLGRKHLWLPDVILRQSVKTRKLSQTLEKADKPIGVADTMTKERLGFLTGKTGRYAVAAGCLFIALFSPLMEFVPLSANVAGLSIFFFGLALVASDGLMVILGFLNLLITSTVIWLVLT